jgi:class 3 adenylate cyclase
MDAEPGRLLVVDDQEMNRDMLARRFRRKGFAVDTASSGREALEKIGSASYDTVLLDIMMPGIDGLEVLETVRRTRNMTELPVIMVTAKTERENIVEALARGANDYVTKPVDFPVALARVRTQLTIRSLQKDLDRERAWIHDVFGRYVAHDVRDAVLSGEAPLDGAIRDVSVLFADLKGFTSLNELHDTRLVVELLNAYFREMSLAVNEEGGLVLQFLGDEVYAVFGAPVENDAHPSQAFRAACKMRARLAALNERHEGQGKPALRHSIGIHSGPVLAASLGAPDRQTYLLVGDTVNVASRLQAFASERGEEIVLSADTHARLDPETRDAAPLVRLEPVRLKGKENPVGAFSAPA